ncbi:MAG: hypothetical protein M0R21_10950 [Lentimicrobiaceae bacterium]|nr:hypothetical protein [Lentimicrobiaceae bacterium]
MKKIGILLIVVLSITMANAQKAKRTSAFNYLKNGQLDKAKDNIDPCITNEATALDPKTWFYRGNIYLQIHTSPLPAYKNLAPNALQIAYESYKKALELDTKKEYYSEIINNMMAVSEQFFNKGVEYYNNSAFSDAQKQFEEAINVNKTYGNTDTLSYFSAALCSELGGNIDKAIEYYQFLRSIKYKKPMIYSSLANLYMKKNNPDEGLAVIKDGKELFQNDFDLIIAETNIYLGTNQNAKAKKNLKVAIEKDPNNSTIWFAYGTIYDTEHNIDSAEIAYKKAIELKPDYFDPIYNIGALYVNKASEILEAANKLPFEETQKYEAEKIKADSFLRMSIPYLEKALEMQPNDKNTLISLKEIYTRLQIYDKLKVINAKIEEIKK